MSEKIKIQKIFLNAMDSWFSNFIIETFRTDHLPESKSQTEFMGTINDKKNKKLPMYFEPKIINFEFNTAYENIIFTNDIIIYNLNTGNVKELEYIINGLNSLNLTTEKLLIIISNIMTWSKTPDKIKKDESTDEIIFIHPDDIKKEIPKKEKENTEENLEEKNNNNEEINNNLEENKETLNLENNNNENESKEEKTIKDDLSKIISNKTISEKNEEEKKIIVYYTEKDYLLRKPNSKYMQYKYIENEALSLNQKKNIKAYVICPGFIYGYGEKTFYSIFRNAILNIPIEEILIDKGRNIIPTIHMKDLINIISKIIEKKPNSYYILAFDQTKNNSLLNIAKSIYDCVGDIKKFLPPPPVTEEENEKNNENNNENENNVNNEEQKEKSINSNKNNNNNNTIENKNNSEHDTISNKNEENNDINNNINNNISLTQKKKISFFSNNKFNISKDFPRDLLYLDIKLLPSEFIKGEPKKNFYNNESDEEDNLSNLKQKNENIEYTPLFKWHSQYGIISNPQSIRKEFIKYRNLSTNTILILGNPYVGKTELSTIISKIFHLPLINIKMISDYGKLIAGINSNNNPDNNIINNNDENIEINNYRKNSIEKDLIRDIQKFMKELDENRALAEDNYNKRKDKKKTDPPFDENKYYRFNDELLVRILDRRVQQNDTVMYGYILDGFPKNSKQAKELFENFEKNNTIPNSIIIFDNVEDDFIINRIKSNEKFPKDPKDPQANVILEKVNRRLGKIKENKEKKEYIDLVDFFKNGEKYKDKIIFLDTKKEIIDLVKESQEFIIKNNNNKINQTDEMLNCNDYLYDYIKEQEIKKQKEEEELLKQQQLEENKNNPEINEAKNNKEIIEENKENKENTTNNEEIKEENNNKENNNEIDNNTKKENDINISQENKEEKIKIQNEQEIDNVNKLLQKKSEVLRRYLSENVLPLLSLGILQVATDRPDDPVEALADFLLDKTLELEKQENKDKNKNKDIEDNKENKTENETTSNKDK